MTNERRYCTKPFSHFEVVGEGDAHLCCPSWLKTSIGDLNRLSIQDVWNSETAHKIRESIIDGSYRYCDKDICPYLKSSRLDVLEELPPNIREMVVNKQTAMTARPKYVLLGYDFSCNLSCPSCRPEKVMTEIGSPAFKKVEEITRKIDEEFIQAEGENLTLNITGSGDPFASNVYRSYLEKLDGKNLPHLKIDLQTNGLLFTPKMWERMHKIHGNIQNVFVSIDAAAEETYLMVRREGNWTVLLNNMRFLADLRRQKKINLLQARFVVQKANYKEMEDFAKLFLKLGCDVIEFALLVDWQSWPAEVFNEQCVWEPRHPEREKFLAALSKSFLSHERVFLGNLTDLRKEAIARQMKTLPPLKRMFFRLSHKKQRIINLIVHYKIKLSKFIRSRMIGNDVKISVSRNRN